jgi:tryptophanyl-tRNA synthetase
MRPEPLGNVSQPGVAKHLQALVFLRSMKTHRDPLCREGYAGFKKALSEVIIEHFKPIQTRFRAIMENRAYLETLLDKRAETAREMAGKIF